MDATQLWLQTDHDTLTNQQPVGAAQVFGSAGPSLGAGHGSCTHALLEGVASAATSVSRHVQPLLQPPRAAVATAAIYTHWRWCWRTWTAPQPQLGPEGRGGGGGVEQQCAHHALCSAGMCGCEGVLPGERGLYVWCSEGRGSQPRRVDFFWACEANLGWVGGGCPRVVLSVYMPA